MAPGTAAGQAFGPGRLTELAGWYSSTGGPFLLTHMPEADLGEPMVLVRKGDRVLRAQPRGEDRLAVADGSVVLLSGLRRDPCYREREVTFTSGGSTLHGTLIMPAGAGPHPVAVLVHGAAGGQRDFSRLFAQEFLAAGVAALIYDKPGHGRSQGPGNPTIFDQADAASAAADFLRTQPDLDSARIGLAGFSNGMWAVPMACARTSGIAFVTGIGAPGVTMAESEVHRRVRILRDAGIGADALRAAAVAWRTIFSIAATGGATADLDHKLASALATLHADERARAYQPAGYARNNPMLSPLPPQTSAAEVASMLGGAADPELGYDPAGDYRTVGCPVLLQFGGCDSSVPTAESVRRTNDALAANHRSAITVYPGLEHMLNIPYAVERHSAEVTMYEFRKFAFGSHALADLRRWLRREVAGRPPAG